MQKIKKLQKQGVERLYNSVQENKKESRSISRKFEGLS